MFHIQCVRDQSTKCHIKHKHKFIKVNRNDFYIILLRFLFFMYIFLSFAFDVIKEVKIYLLLENGNFHDLFYKRLFSCCCKHFMLINFSYFQFLFSYLRFLFFVAIRNSYEMKMVLSFMKSIFFYKNCSCKFHQLRLHFLQSAKILNIIVALKIYSVL